MPSFNRVTLMGNLTRDPQLKQLPSNTTVAEFGLAMSRRFKTQAGEDREEVCFVDCSAFGRQAEVIGQYCTKGKPLFVEGRLKYDQWDDKTSGLRRSKLTVVVESFQFVGGPQDGQQQTANGNRQSTFEDVRREQTAAPSKSKMPTKSRGEERSFTEADIPF
jgi:single-strand DNA-binding protein